MARRRGGGLGTVRVVAPTLTADYALLQVSSSASDAELHTAYRNQLKLHHPDRHGGSHEATLRSQEIGAAYERIVAARKGGAPRSRPQPPPSARAAPPRPETDTDRRIAEMEREVRARAAAAEVREAAERERERVRRAAREAAAEAMGVDPPSPSSPVTDEEDSFGAIFRDTVEELRERARRAQDHPAVRRAQELLDAVEDRSHRDRDR